MKVFSKIEVFAIQKIIFSKQLVRIIDFLKLCFPEYSFSHADSEIT